MLMGLREGMLRVALGAAAMEAAGSDAHAESGLDPELTALELRVQRGEVRKVDNPYVTVSFADPLNTESSMQSMGFSLERDGDFTLLVSKSGEKFNTWNHQYVIAMPGGNENLHSELTPSNVVFAVIHAEKGDLLVATITCTDGRIIYETFRDGKQQTANLLNLPELIGK